MSPLWMETDKTLFDLDLSFVETAEERPRSVGWLRIRWVRLPTIACQMTRKVWNDEAIHHG